MLAGWLAGTAGWLADADGWLAGTDAAGLVGAGVGDTDG
jgi:hypothetical protein